MPSSRAEAFVIVGRIGPTMRTRLETMDPSATTAWQVDERGKCGAFRSALTIHLTRLRAVVRRACESNAKLVWLFTMVSIRPETIRPERTDKISMASPQNDAASFGIFVVSGPICLERCSSMLSFQRPSLPLTLAIHASDSFQARDSPHRTHRSDNMPVAAQ